MSWDGDGRGRNMGRNGWAEVSWGGKGWGVEGKGRDMGGKVIEDLEVKGELRGKW